MLWLVGLVAVQFDLVRFDRSLAVVVGLFVPCSLWRTSVGQIVLCCGRSVWLILHMVEMAGPIRFGLVCYGFVLCLVWSGVFLAYVVKTLEQNPGIHVFYKV